MMRFLYVGTYGAENPTKSSLPFVWASSARDAGHEAEVFLYGDAVVMMKDVVAEGITPVGWPKLAELLATVKKSGVRVYL